jgi:hypothetical protein
LPPASAVVRAPAAPASGAQSFSSNANAAELALQLEEERAGGGGGGGGHHPAKKALASIDDIAARNSLNIEDRKKTMLDRQREIDRMKAELAEADQPVGEKEPGEDGGRKEDEQPGTGDEQP